MQFEHTHNTHNTPSYHCLDLQTVAQIRKWNKNLFVQQREHVFFIQKVGGVLTEVSVVTQPTGVFKDHSKSIYFSEKQMLSSVTQR